MNHTKQTSFILYHDFEPMLQLLSMEQRGMLITAIFDYSVRGMKTEDLPDVVNMAFCCIQRALERDAIAYEEKCRINAENGKKGGRPRKDSLISKTEGFFEKTKKAYSDNDSDSDSDNDTDIDSDNDTVSDSDHVHGSGNGSERENNRHGSASTHGSAAPLTEYDKQELKGLGVPLDYISPRQSRALSYAQASGKKVTDVLLSWWREDQRKKASPPRKAPPKSENKSYDIDDFFQAALTRSNRNLAGAG